MRAQHINITIPVDLKLKIDSESKRERIGRSTLIQKALNFYLKALKTKRMRALLADGYAEMSGESIAITKEFADLDDEAFRHVD